VLARRPATFDDDLLTTQGNRSRTSIDAPLLRDPDFFDEAQLLDKNLLDHGQDQRIALVSRWNRLRDKSVDWDPLNDDLVVNDRLIDVYHALLDNLPNPDLGRLDPFPERKFFTGDGYDDRCRQRIGH
jgi:hypothetical protein